jgi:hypothetical protein
MPHRFPDGLPAVIPAMMTHLERRLPAPGEILVRPESRVEPDDLIGQCMIQGAPVMIDVTGTLGIAPRDVPRRLRQKPGDHVAFRDLLARRRGRSLLAPVTGTISAIDAATGFAILTPDPVPASVTAAIRGTVVDVRPKESVTIASSAAVVQGVAGFGGDQWGVLRLLVTDPADPISASMIDNRSAFAVVIGGAGISADALRKAREEQVKGIVLGSVDAEQLREFWGERFHGKWAQLLQRGTGVPLVEGGPTLVLTEGFGNHPMNRMAFDLLARYDRHEVHIDGTTRLDPPRQRPRLIIPLARLPEGAPSPIALRQPGVDDRVRLLHERHLGATGQVARLNPHGRLPSGVRTATATVLLTSGERVEVPQQAIEVVA